MIFIFASSKLLKSAFNHDTGNTVLLGVPFCKPQTHLSINSQDLNARLPLKRYLSLRVNKEDFTLTMMTIPVLFSAMLDTNLTVGDAQKDKVAAIGAVALTTYWTNSKTFESHIQKYNIRPRFKNKKETFINVYEL